MSDSPPEPILTLVLTSVDLTDPRIPVFHISADTPKPPYTRDHSTPTRSYTELERLSGHLTARFPDRLPPFPPTLPTKESVPLFRSRIQTFLNRIAARFGDVDAVVSFVESEFEFAPSGVLQTKKSGFLRAFSGGSIHVKEVDVFFESAKGSIGACEAALGMCARVGEKAGRVEREMGATALEVGNLLLELDVGDRKGLGGALRKLGKGFIASEKPHVDQANYLTHQFAADAKTFMRETQAAQAALTYRLTTLQSYEAACKATQKKLASLDRLRSSSSIKQERVDAALVDLQEVKQQEGECRAQFRTVSERLKDEYVRFCSELDVEVREVVDSYVEAQKEGAKKELAVWESVLAGFA
ncbi:uncharacterized protein SPPG_05214 [Spizellomyces punctatus DAOM BR117]|uniref:Sorting nexin/Vps5-like C-terminal domain-containing protein n=1 Tax=Spizellomyces punctatus (strain DAOM BR117) TaxID=645134 RepID=A0A0L0HEE5_SPIPD|nr:uncharacterized protein SPPG_05214 [Spizellomyces punctatus DAOM BR117]KNC99840.1 hypothetical protein SPPG_05214 [Spizellomyces punctatus DAOM BR117]|eukprot:XP_016607880.1 hypothetical protein SPPG_05214 [Spizellomyces punctatus DAOM BR117]